MAWYDINTPLRQAHFLAQILHECGLFQFMSELWGPTASQKRYDPPSSLAKQLGNTQSGDGFVYRGRGAIQLTGKFNYQKYADYLTQQTIDLTPEGWAPRRA